MKDLIFDINSKIKWEQTIVINTNITFIKRISENCLFSGRTLVGNQKLEEYRINSVTGISTIIFSKTFLNNLVSNLYSKLEK